MTEHSIAAGFDECLEAVRRRMPDSRQQIVIEMMAASIRTADLDRVRRVLDRRSDGLSADDAALIDRLPEQFAAVMPQIVALDLDRTPPMQVLGLGTAAATLVFGARTLGHGVTMACRSDRLTNLLLGVYRVPRFDPRKIGELPDGHFDLIVSAGAEMFANKKRWTSFVSPLAGKLAETGRIFVALDKEPIPGRDYYPEIVLANLAKMGARVSSKAHFVMLDKATIGKFKAD